MVMPLEKPIVRNECLDVFLMQCHRNVAQEQFNKLLFSEKSMNHPQQKIKAFQQHILNWYAQHKRDLPWRKTHDPYAILVSEVMLQQTQVERVVHYYGRFLETYPTMEALASAEKVELLKMWQGLGYNNRVLRLQQFAQELMQRKKGFPETYAALLELPGIGPYTARAILAFAFNQAVPVVDTNIRRVLIHELGLDERIFMQELEVIAQQCIPRGKSREWHNALMDYGALFATARATGVESLSKQGKFEGSTRQARSSIVRHLLEKKRATLMELREKYPHREFDAIVKKMLKEGLVREKNGKMVL